MAQYHRLNSDVLEPIVGKRIHEVSNNINTSLYLSLRIGEELQVVDEYEYRLSQKEQRPCQPLRQYGMICYCPYAIAEGSDIVWSTDDDIDITSWAYVKGRPYYNLDVAPRLMGAHVVSMEVRPLEFVLRLNNNIGLHFYPFEDRPDGAHVEHFYSTSDPADAEPVLCHDIVICDWIRLDEYIIREGHLLQRAENIDVVLVDRDSGICHGK